MPIQIDRQLIISTGTSRTSKRWPASTVWWSELVARLATPVRGTESLDVYLSWPKPQQDTAKDVGGFVGGSLKGQRRKASAVQGRDIVTLDLDHVPAGGTDDVLRRLGSLQCAYCVYSTRKHHPGEPRLRVLLPLHRTVTADEYEPLARKLMWFIDPEMRLCDPTTFEASRLMYWPSCSADSQYVYLYEDKPFANPDGILALYRDWRAIGEWPEVPGVTPVQRLAAKQGDPMEKNGIVGAFCRIYDIYSAMEELLPEIYEPSDAGGYGQDGRALRYTFTGGSTTGGAVIYDAGKFLFSHHATDPCSGKLVNAFDLVRLHLYGDQDDDVQPGTPGNRLPSYTAMGQFAYNDPQVRALLDEERYQEATKEFTAIVGELPPTALPEPPGGPQDTTGPAGEQDAAWMQNIKRSPTTGQALKTVTNVRILLEYDPLLRGRIRKDLFAGRIIGWSPLPWGSRVREAGSFVWTDDDDAGLREHVERILGFRTENTISDALRNHAAAHSYNPVANFINAAPWDGQSRLDTLYIDYMGADDHPYTRAVARKGLVAAVARAMQPGVKFDTMTTVCGPQGLGKSTLFRRLGHDWFSDSVRSFDGKEAAELLQGRWIVEIGELEAMDRSEVRAVKAFLSREDDQYRAAYARHAESRPRRCAFFGTTNDREYLRDPTGNRRFWPVDAMAQPPTRSVFRDMTADVVAQLWAEAYVRWQMGEPLYLNTELEAEAERRREGHTERDPLQGQIEEFLARPVPLDWQRWTLERRRMYWGGGATSDLSVGPRDRVCAMEIARECLLDTRATLPRPDTTRLNNILQRLPGWEPTSTARFGPDYGRQRGFTRTGINIERDEKAVNIHPPTGKVVNILGNGLVNVGNIRNA